MHSVFGIGSKRIKTRLIRPFNISFALFHFQACQNISRKKVFKKYSILPTYPFFQSVTWTTYLFYLVLSRLSFTDVTGLVGNLLNSTIDVHHNSVKMDKHVMWMFYTLVNKRRLVFNKKPLPWSTIDALIKKTPSKIFINHNLTGMLWMSTFYLNKFWAVKWNKRIGCFHLMFVIRCKQYVKAHLTLYISRASSEHLLVPTTNVLDQTLIICFLQKINY